MGFKTTYGWKPVKAQPVDEKDWHELAEDIRTDKDCHSVSTGNTVILNETGVQTMCLRLFERRVKELDYVEGDDD